MIDHFVKSRTGNPYDKNGAIAAQGQIIEPLLKELQRHPFFDRTPPRSAWRLDFGAAFAEDILARYDTSSTEDLLATVTDYSAWAIESSLKRFVLPRAPDIERLIASGGGVRNGHLIERLCQRLSSAKIQVVVSDEVGLPAPYKEAMKFATLAFATKHSLANNIPAAGGALTYACLGKLTLAPRLAKNAGSMVSPTNSCNGV